MKIAKFLFNYPGKKKSKHKLNPNFSFYSYVFLKIYTYINNKLINKNKIYKFI